MKYNVSSPRRKRRTHTYCLGATRVSGVVKE